MGFVRAKIPRLNPRPCHQGAFLWSLDPLRLCSTPRPPTGTYEDTGLARADHSPVKGEKSAMAQADPVLLLPKTSPYRSDTRKGRETFTIALISITLARSPPSFRQQRADRPRRRRLTLPHRTRPPSPGPSNELARDRLSRRLVS